jgi:hypothetical protein
VKALSIQQPWAWLIVNSHKDIENRDWPTRFRGRIYVHAGKKIDKDAIEYIRRCHPDIPLPSSFDVGGIVGTVVISGCTVEHESKWFFGVYGFMLEEAEALPFVPYRGQLGFFDVVIPTPPPEHQTLTGTE